MLNISFVLSLDSIGCSTFPVHTYILTPHIFNRHVNACRTRKPGMENHSTHSVGPWASGLWNLPQMPRWFHRYLGNVTVLKRYLPLAPEILRECSLDFTYAPLRSEVYQWTGRLISVILHGTSRNTYSLNVPLVIPKARTMSGWGSLTVSVPNVFRLLILV